MEKIDGLELTILKIPAGGFLMSSPEAEEGNDGEEGKAGEEGLTSAEGPQHPVELAEFLMGQTPITSPRPSGGLWLAGSPEMAKAGAGS